MAPPDSKASPPTTPAKETGVTSESPPDPLSATKELVANAAALADTLKRGESGSVRLEEVVLQARELVDTAREVPGHLHGAAASQLRELARELKRTAVSVAPAPRSRAPTCLPRATDMFGSVWLQSTAAEGRRAGLPGR